MEFFRGNRKSAGSRGASSSTAVLAKEPSVHGIPQWEHPKGGCDDPFTKVFESTHHSGKNMKKPHSASSSGQRHHSAHKAGKTHSRQLKDSPARSPTKSPSKPSLKTLMNTRGKEFGVDIVLPSFASEELDARPKIDEIVSSLQGDHRFTSSITNSSVGTAKLQSNVKPSVKRGSVFRPPAPLCAESEDSGSGEDKSDSLSAELFPLHVEESTRKETPRQRPGSPNKAPSLKLSSLNAPTSSHPGPPKRVPSLKHTISLDASNSSLSLNATTSSRPGAPKRVPSLKHTSLEASNSSLVGTRFVANDMSSLQMSLEMSLDDCFADDPHYGALLEEQENEMILLAMENSMQDLGLNSSANFDQMSCRSGDGSTQSACANRGGGGGGGGGRKRLSMIEEPDITDYDGDDGTDFAISFDEKPIWDDLTSSHAASASSMPVVGSAPASGFFSVRERALAEMHQGGCGSPLNESFS